MSVLSTTNIVTDMTWNGSTFESSTSVTVPSGTNLVIVALGCSGNFDSAQFGGVALTEEISVFDDDASRFKLYSFPSPTEGANNVVFQSISQRKLRGVVYCVSETTVRGTSSGTSFTTNSSSTISTIADDLVIGGTTHISATSVSDVSQTDAIDDLAFDTNKYVSSSYEVATTTSTVHSYTLSPSGRWANASIAVYSAAPANTTINVDIPLHINLKWDTTHQLAVTHDGGTTTLEGVALSTPTGWETVTYSGSLPAGDSFASLAATDATLGGGGYTMQAGDILAWETQTGLTVDVNTTPVVSPAATVSGSYKIWNEVGQTWTSVSTFTINDLGLNVGSTIPVDDRSTFQAMVGYLITQGYQGAGNETIQKWLIAEGISKKSFNEMLRDYLTGLGYNGTLPEQLRDWRNG